MATKTSPMPRVAILLAVFVCIVATARSNPQDSSKPSDQSDTASPTPKPSPLSPFALEVLLRRGETALKTIGADSDLKTKKQASLNHLASLVPYPGQTIAWLEKLNEQSLGNDHQQWNKFFLDYQTSLPKPPTGSFPFLPRVIPPPDVPLDAEGQAKHAQQDKKRELRISNVKFLIILYQDLLANDQMLLPTAQLLPSLGPVFINLIEDGQDSTTQETLTFLFENLDDFWINQLLAIDKIKSPPMADLIRRHQDKWLLPLALQSPSLAGELAGHLLANSAGSDQNPLDYASIAFRNVGREIAQKKGLVHLAHFLGHFLEQCPAVGILLEDSHREVIKDAWNDHFAGIVADQPEPAKPNWNQVYREAFLKPAGQLNADERAILAFGMRSFLNSHLDTFSYGSPDGKAIPPRIVMRSTLAGILSPYPGFQVCAICTAINRRHDFKEESQATAKQLKAFLLDRRQPFYLRFEIARRAIQIQYRGATEFQKMAPALSSILCEFVDQGYSAKEVYAGHILTEIRTQAETSPNKSLWQKQCAKVAASWADACLLPNSVFKKDSIHILNELVECALASGDKNLIEKILSDHSSRMQGNFPLIGKLILAEKIPQAISLCKDLSSLNRNYRGLYFTAPMELALPVFLPEIQNKANRFIVETHLTGRDNPFEGEIPTTRRIDRLRALATRYPEIQFPSPRTEVACLSILSSEPSVAWLLRKELGQKVGVLKVSQFKRRGPEFAKRGLGRFSDMLLYNAYLGNLARAGEHETVSTITREILELTKEGIDHGAWMLGDLLRVLYDHFLVMAKDGRTPEIASYRDLSREIYHLMTTNHKGWNYRSQSLAIMIFCHAAAKEFDQLLSWAKNAGGEVSKHYQEYHRKLLSNWSPRQNPFTNLAIYSDARGGFDTPELAPHRRAATLILMEDPALLKEATHSNFLTHCAKFTVNRSKVLTFEDVIAILKTWKERHPNHPGWPEEFAAASAALEER